MKQFFAALSLLWSLCLASQAQAGKNYLIVFVVPDQPQARTVFAPLDGAAKDGKAIITAAQESQFIPKNGVTVEKNTRAVDEEISFSDKAEAFLRKNQYLLLSASNGYPPTKANIMALPKLLSAVVKSDDKVLTYFSGHGAVVDGEAFLISADTRISQKDMAREGIRNSAVSVKAFTDKMGGVSCFLLVGIYDMCRTPVQSGSLTAKGADKPQDDLLHTLGADRVTTPLREEATLTAKEEGAANVYTLFSTMDGHASLEDTNLGRGLFSKFFEEGLCGGAFEKGVVTLASLKSFINAKTRDYLTTKFKIDDDDAIPVAAGKVGKSSEKGNEVENIPLLSRTARKLIGYSLRVTNDKIPIISAKISFQPSSFDKDRLISRDIVFSDINDTASFLRYKAQYEYEGGARQPSSIRINHESSAVAGGFGGGELFWLEKSLWFLDIPLPPQAEKKMGLTWNFDAIPLGFDKRGDKRFDRHERFELSGSSKIIAREKVGNMDMEAWNVEILTESVKGNFWLDDANRVIQMDFKDAIQPWFRLKFTPLWENE